MKKDSLTNRSLVSKTAEAGASAEQGMYLYALIADGTVVDTKRMVLTK